MSVFLTDRYSISKRERTPDGYLLIKDNPVARPGVMLYRAAELGDMFKDRDPDSTVRVYRDPAVLFAADCMNSYKGKPVTAEHPPKLLDSTNVMQYQTGASREDASVSHASGTPTVNVSLLIQDQRTIDRVESGELTELSPGRRATVVPVEHSEYDAITTEDYCNHIALVPRARGGRDLKLSDKQTLNVNHKEDIDMADTVTIMLDGITVETTKAGKEAVEKLQSLMAKMEQTHGQELTDAEAKYNTLKTESEKKIDTLTAERDDAKSQILTDADIEERVTERVELVDTAAKLDKSYDCKGKDAATIKRELVQSLCDADMTDKSAEYVQARFDALVERQTKEGSIRTTLKDANLGGDAPKKDAVTEARERKMASNREAWKRGDDK